MNITINRLDPNLPDPIESRRRAAGRLVRLAYGTTVFGVLAFFVAYFGAPLVFLSGPGTVTAPRYVVSLPHIVQVQTMSVSPGAVVKAGQEIGTVSSPQIDGVLATYMSSLADEVDGSRSRHHGAKVSLPSGNPSQGAIRHADYHRGP
jgi:HlyD family secretion protein